MRELYDQQFQKIHRLSDLKNEGRLAAQFAVQGAVKVVVQALSKRLHRQAWGGMRIEVRRVRGSRAYQATVGPRELLERPSPVRPSKTEPVFILTPS